MGLRRSDGSGGILRDLDLLRGQLRHSAWIFPRLAPRSHPRLGARCRGNLLVAGNGGGDPLSGLSRFWHPAGIAGLCRSPRRHLCRCICLVVAHGSTAIASQKEKPNPAPWIAGAVSVPALEILYRHECFPKWRRAR